MARRWVRGEDHPKTTLTNEQVRRIRILCAEGMLHRELAAIFGVSRTTISNIIHRYSWAHIE